MNFEYFSNKRLGAMLDDTKSKVYKPDNDSPPKPELNPAVKKLKDEYYNYLAKMQKENKIAIEEQEEKERLEKEEENYKKMREEYGMNRKPRTPRAPSRERKYPDKNNTNENNTNKNAIVPDNFFTRLGNAAERIKNAASNAAFNYPRGGKRSRKQKNKQSRKQNKKRSQKHR
jgi:hypothetical protein